MYIHMHVCTHTHITHIQVPCTPSRYVGTIIAVVLLAVFVAFLKVARVRLEHKFERAAISLETLQVLQFITVWCVAARCSVLQCSESY